MYGNGIGTLSVIIMEKEDNTESEIWSLNGEAGNAWYQAEVPIASPAPFRIILAARVGKNHLGDIAIDDVSVIPGSCPSKDFQVIFQLLFCISLLFFLLLQFLRKSLRFRQVTVASKWTNAVG